MIEFGFNQIFVLCAYGFAILLLGSVVVRAILTARSRKKALTEIETRMPDRHV